MPGDGERGIGHGSGRRRSRGRRESTLEGARGAAYKLLAVQARTEAELRQALSVRGYSQDHVEQAMAEMISRGYINDHVTARRWAGYAAQEQRHGVGGIALRLVRRGIDHDLARAAAAEAYESEGIDEREAALSLARKRITAADAADDESRQRACRRVAGFLERRGFRADAIAHAISELFT
ncbi:MAG: regulatory protein RecX [Clostridia bacterium]|nr:regulatory protein RecX [Clostridia bacterium]